MRGVDQQRRCARATDSPRGPGAAEPADPHRHRLARRARRCGPASDSVDVQRRRGRPAAPPAAAPPSVPPRMRMRRMAACLRRIAHETAASPRWLSIVGIGEDGVDGLGAGGARPDRRGGDRVRRQAPPRPCGAADPWRGAALAEPVRRRGRRGAGAVAAAASACSPPAIRSTTASARRWRAASIAREMTVVPAPSAFSLAAARLGWSLPDDGAALPARPHPRSRSARICSPARASWR